MRSDAIDEEALRRLVGRFYARVRGDALLGPLFNSAVHDWPEHLDRLQAFWSSVMLTSGRYKGQPLPAHVRHAGEMSPDRFARWLDLWRETCAELFAPAAAAILEAKAERIAERLSAAVAAAVSRCGPAPTARAAASAPSS